MYGGQGSYNQATIKETIKDMETKDMETKEDMEANKVKNTTTILIKEDTIITKVVQEEVIALVTAAKLVLLLYAVAAFAIFSLD